MASVTCRSCGRRYDYSQHDCCPECGAYNRPPRHEQVDADGTVRHLTDADYAKRKSAALGKVCFEDKECYEEKVCYEDEARETTSRADKQQQARKMLKQRLVFLVMFLVFFWLSMGRRSRLLTAGSPFTLFIILAVSMIVLNILFSFMRIMASEEVAKKLQRVEAVIVMIVSIVLMIAFVRQWFWV